MNDISHSKSVSVYPVSVVSDMMMKRQMSGVRQDEEQNINMSSRENRAETER